MEDNKVITNRDYLLDVQVRAHAEKLHILKMMVAMNPNLVNLTGQIYNKKK